MSYCYYSTVSVDQANGLKVSLSGYDYPTRDAQLRVAAERLAENARRANCPRSANYGRAVAQAILEGRYTDARSITC